MAVNGWVSIHRDILNSDLWLSEKFTRGQAWVDLIMLANHKDGYFRKRGVRVDIKRGQVGYSELALSDRWRWSRGKVNRYLNELETDGNIVQQKTHVTTLITIVKYNIYQVKQDSKQDNRRTTNGQQTNINNKDNNGNNGNKEEKKGNFKPPLIKELQAYTTEKNLSIDPDTFIDHYQSNNWMVGKSKMKDWKAAARNWSRRDSSSGYSSVQQRMAPQTKELKP